MGTNITLVQHGLCFRCGEPLLEKVAEGKPLKRIVLVDTVEGQRGICCKECVRPGDHVV